MTTRPHSTTSVPDAALRAPIVPRRDFLPFSPPLIGEEEISEVVDTLRSDWITTGPKTKRFEKEFAAYLDAPGALALNSCTAGLHTALATLGIGPGDEVITTPMTFAASRSEEHTSELQSRGHLVCRLLLEKKKVITGCLLYVCAPKN